WALRLDTRGPTLAAATLLVPPYLFTYDSLLLIVPMGWIIRKQKHPAAIAVIWLLCLLPIISYSGAFTGPNTVPVAAALCLFLLYRSEGGRAALWPYRWSRPSQARARRSRRIGRRSGPSPGR